MKPFTTVRRTALRGALAACLFAAPPLAAPASAQSLQDYAARLATIDSDLAACWRVRAAAAVIVAKFLRECIAERRPDERELKDDLNKWISTLGGDDPLRRQALDIRVDLNGWTRFINQLVDNLKPYPEEVDPRDLPPLVDDACTTLRAREAPRLDADAFEPPSGYKRRAMVVELCSD